MSTFLQQLINGISLGAIYSLIALGYTMVYGVLKLINFAHGDVYMVGAFMGYYLANGLGARGAQAIGQSADGLIARGLLGSGAMEPSLITALVVMLLAMAICAALGVIIERFAYRPVRKYSRLTALITAIGVSLLLENGGQVVFGADPKFFPGAFQEAKHRLVWWRQYQQRRHYRFGDRNRSDDRFADRRLSNQDRTRDARCFFQPAIGETDGYQHGSNHHVHLRPGLCARSCRRGFGGDSDPAH